MSMGDWCGEWIRLGGGVWGAGILGPQVPWPLRRAETQDARMEASALGHLYPVLTCFSKNLLKCHCAPLLCKLGPTSHRRPGSSELKNDDLDEINMY